MLLALSAETDQTPFWFVLFVEPVYSWPIIHIVDVYPPRQFDAASRQLHTDPIPKRYYNLNRFKIIDGILDLSLVAIRPLAEVPYSCPKLIVGRQASSRRQAPEPWCQFADSLESFEPEQPHADFIAQYEAGSPSPDGLNVTSHRILEGFEKGSVIRASVREKEISGIMHYLVAVDLVHGQANGNQAMILQKEDRLDNETEPTANQTDGEPLYLHSGTGDDHGWRDFRFRSESSEYVRRRNTTIVDPFNLMTW